MHHVRSHRDITFVVDWAVKVKYLSCVNIYRSELLGIVQESEILLAHSLHQLNLNTAHSVC